MSNHYSLKFGGVYLTNIKNHIYANVDDKTLARGKEVLKKHGLNPTEVRTFRLAGSNNFVLLVNDRFGDDAQPVIDMEEDLPDIFACDEKLQPADSFEAASKNSDPFKEMQEIVEIQANQPDGALFIDGEDAWLELRPRKS